MSVMYMLNYVVSPTKHSQIVSISYVSYI